MPIKLGNYWPGDSLLHRLDPRVKLCLSIALMVVIFYLQTAGGIIALIGFIVAMLVIAKLPIFSILKSLKSIAFFALLAMVMNFLTMPGKVLWQMGFLTVTDAGLYSGVLVAVRLVLLVLISTIFLTAVTTPLAMADALEKLLTPLARFKFPAHELAMMMSIALRFVPTIMLETTKIMKAQTARGANFDTGGIFKRLKGLITVLVPLFVAAIQRAEDLALAMEARCYNGGVGRTKLHPLKMVGRDYLLALVGILCIIAILAFDRFVYSLVVGGLFRL